MQSISRLSIIILMATIVPALHGAVLTVPGEYDFIQDGLDAALEGDTILVADGTFDGPRNRDLDFGGKGVTLLSANGAASTIISCGFEGRGVAFMNGEGSGSVLEGFSITDGSPSAPDLFGGGIYCSYASPTIVSCRIVDCEAMSWFGSGGGICCKDNSSPAVFGCEFYNNRSSDIFGRGGGAHISRHSDPLFSGCTFESNSSYCGGGSYIHRYSNPMFEACMFDDNSAWNSGGGAFTLAGSDPVFRNCVFIDNSGGNLGAGLYANSACTLTHCSLTGNLTMLHGGAVYIHDAEPVIEASILWQNFPDEIFANSGDAFVTYSVISGGWPGEGNIDADPGLLEDGYHLAAASPCVDMAPDFGVAVDFDGESRPQGEGADTGADEYVVGGLEAGVVDFPDCVELAEHLEFTVVVANTGSEGAFFDEAVVSVEGPASTNQVLYDGAPLEVPPRESLQASVSLYVPLSSPQGDYTITFIIYLDGVELSRDSFIVEVAESCI